METKSFVVGNFDLFVCPDCDLHESGFGGWIDDGSTVVLLPVVLGFSLHLPIHLRARQKDRQETRETCCNDAQAPI